MNAGRRPPDTLRVLRLLTGSAVLRLLRAVQLAKATRRSQTRLRTSRKRVPTRRKRADGLMLLLLLMLPFMALQALLVSARGVQELARATPLTGDRDVLTVSSHVHDVLRWGRPEADIGSEVLRDALRNSRLHPYTVDEILAHYERHGVDGFERAPQQSFLTVGPEHWPNDSAREATLDGVTLLVLLLSIALLCISLGASNADLGRVEWSFTWLLSFPVPTRAIVLAKVAEYGLINLLPWFLVSPLYLQVFLAAGHGWWSLPLAAAATLSATLMLGALRFWLETHLRLRLSLRGVRNWQGFFTLTGFLLLMAPLVLLMRLDDGLPRWLNDLVLAVPRSLRGLPFAWPLTTATHGVQAWVLGVAMTAAIVGLAIGGASRLLRHGAVRSGGVDPGVRGRVQNTRRSWLPHGILGKDLRLLLRDRNFMVQTLVVPVVIIGINVFTGSSVGKVGGASGTAAIAYGIGTFTLTGGCFQILSGEGRALWMLYTMPVSLADMLHRKLRLWSGVAIGFAWIALGVLTIGQPRPALALLADALFVGGGVFAAAHIAAAIAALGTNPAADHVPRTLKARHVYLFLFLASTYLACLMSPTLPTRCAGLLVFATLAYAIWQRLRDRIPYLLDPIETGSPGFSLYHAGAAVTMFTLLQIMFASLLSLGSATFARGMPMVTLAFVLAGAITLMVFLVMFRSGGMKLVSPDDRRVALLPSAAIGLLVGGAGGAIALFYLRMVERQGWFELPAAELDSTGAIAFAVLAVLAAPLIEEPLFRGMVFQSLRRSVSLRTAVLWSAALFTVLHPAAGWPPIFLFATAAAILARHTGSLLPPIVAHATYNAILVFCS